MTDDNIIPLATGIFHGSVRILIEFVYKTHYILMYIVNFPALFVG